jgi:eukaryotic-like serine/threonine-protein kinase
MSLEVGSKIGDYEIVSVLGAGGMGKVYKVRNTISDRVEAMKVLLPDLEHEPDLADRFMREIKVQASLQHPNIAALHTALRVENQLLMIMELVEGVTLEQRLHQGPIPLRYGVDYICQVLEALGYAHQHGVIHRDIKPANMMLMPNGVVKLMDFGIAKAAADRRLTITGTTMGSLYYMSPEQIKGMSTLDARSDLYSMGVSLYEIVTGKKPFDGDSQFAIMAAHLEKTPVPPITLDTNLPQALNDVILMAIARDPDQRFQSAQAFRAALGSVKEIVGVPDAAPVSASAPTVSMPSRAVPPSMQATAAMPVEAPIQAPPPMVAASELPPKSSKRWLWVSAGALATVLVLVAAIQFGPWRKTSAQSGPPPAPESATPSTGGTTTPVTPTPPPPVVTTSQPDQQPAASNPAPATPPQEEVKPAAKPNRSAQKPLVHQTARQSVGTAPVQTSEPGGANQATQAKPAPPAGPDPAVLQELRESLVQLSARAGAVRTSLQNLKRSQAANGMSLRGDMAAAETRMNSMMEGANAALNAQDAASAKKFIDSADGEVEKLEKFLGM